MASLVELALTALLAAPAPQGEDETPQYPMALTKAEHQKLNNLARKWFAAEKKWEEADGQKRARARKTRDKTKDAFDREWEKKDKKEPLKHVGDLLKVFENVFEYPKQRAYGEIKIGQKGRIRGVPYGLMVPQKYKADEAYRAVICLPARDGDKWLKPKDQFEQTWKGAKSLAEDTIFVIPEVPDEMELDPMPDRSSENDLKIEAERRAILLDPAGTVQVDYNFDRNRVFLDCGRGTGLFGLRVATYFPSRFAGVILRDPKAAPDDFRLGSLTGLPVLLVQGPDNADDCKKLKARFDELQPGSCLIVEQGDQAKVAEWTAGISRNLFRKKVVIEPTDDLYKRAFWAEITVCEPILGVAPADRPRLVVEADRDANRITITAKSVSNFRILLNDALVDLDKEFAIVVNGKVINETRSRQLYKVVQLVRSKFDPNYLFPADYATTVPKAEGDANGGGGDKPK